MSGEIYLWMLRFLRIYYLSLYNFEQCLLVQSLHITPKKSWVSASFVMYSNNGSPLWLATPRRRGEPLWRRGRGSFERLRRCSPSGKNAAQLSTSSGLWSGGEDPPHSHKVLLPCANDGYKNTWFLLQSAAESTFLELTAADDVVIRRQ